MLLDKITAKFQLRLKDRNSAGNILGEALKEVIKNGKEIRDHNIVLGIPFGAPLRGVPGLLPMYAYNNIR